MAMTSGESLDLHVVRSPESMCGRISVPGPWRLEVPGKKPLTKGSGEFCLFLFLTVMRKLLEPRTENECLQSLRVGCRGERLRRGLLAVGAAKRNHVEQRSEAMTLSLALQRAHGR